MSFSVNKIGIVGFSGFIGKEICDFLQNTDNEVFYFGRSSSLSPKKSNFSYFSHDKPIDNFSYLKKCDVIIYLAGVSKYNKNLSIPKNLYFKSINCDLTIDFARAAASFGVKRFIFISSIKVNGESTEIGAPFISDSNYIPDDPYALSKYEAEQGLLEISKYSNMEVVIIRPPLVYGPGVKANFGKIIRLVTKGIPLPLGSIQNCRSYIALDNIVDFILLCADRSRSPKAANQIFLISDGPCISTSDLIRKIAFAYNKTIFLIPVGPLIKFILRIFREKKYFERLFSNLVVDYSKAEKLLNWKPVVSMDEQLSKMGNLYYKRLKDD